MTNLELILATALVIAVWGLLEVRGVIRDLRRQVAWWKRMTGHYEKLWENEHAVSQAAWQLLDLPTYDRLEKCGKVSNSTEETRT